MFESLLDIIRCPVTRSKLQLQVISKRKKKFLNEEREIVWEGILYGDDNWFYPIINGIPRLIVEAFDDYQEFLSKHVTDYAQRKNFLEENNHRFLKYVRTKNAHTKASFAQEWGLYNYETDKTWDLDAQGMLNRFCMETDETENSLKGKFVFDAGCGNGHLNIILANNGTPSIAMDFSLSIVRAFERNENPLAQFIQGDVQFPPVDFEKFDIVHSSGVLIATHNTELSFSCLSPCVKSGGKLSVWLYQPRKNFIHNLFNFIRNYSSKLPVRFQYYLYAVTLLPISFVVKRMKGNKQNTREMMIDILDWFSPQYRWEHEPSEAAAWYHKRNYSGIKVTHNNMWGFNIIGVKNQKP